MNRKLILILFVLITGCAVQETSPPEDTRRLLNGKVLHIKDVDLPGQDVLATNAEMRNWVRDRIRASTNPRSRLQSLVSGMIEDGLLTLEYDQDQTQTAINTFTSRSGNCLSFSILFVALAREAGLEVSFQMVEIPPSFSASGELVMLNNHINVLVHRIRTNAQFHQNHVVDFNTAEYSGNYETRRVTDKYAIALFHSNVGVERLKEKHTASAFRHFRRAIQLDPGVPGIWTNLGVLYAKTGHYGYAIDAYNQALSLKPSYKSALVNLIAAHTATKNLEQAEHFKRRASFYQRMNPYFHYQRAREYFEHTDYDSALDSLNTAIALKRDEHQFFFLKGLIHLNQGEIEQAEESYRRARDVAQRADIAGRYSQKLDLLNRIEEQF